MSRNLKLRFKPTGNVFVLPEANALEFLRGDRGNYEILDKDFVEDIQEEPKDTTTYEKVVVEEKPKKKVKKVNK